MFTRSRAILSAVFLLLGLAVACTQQAPTPPTGATKSGGANPVPTVAAPSSTASPATQSVAPADAPTISAKTAASPASSPQTAPSPVASAAQGESKGTFVYGYHVALSPLYFDPQEVASVITPWGFLYALHDGLVKSMPGQPFAPSLAESFEIAPDLKSATFKLRDGIKFHNGDPVTPEDVKFTFENYKGASAKLLHDTTERIDTPDARTVRFVFKAPFPDFLMLYGSPATGAGWIVPKKYYEQVGPNGFKQRPIGAGPYKFVRFEAGKELELEAFADYWRKTPGVKTLIYRELTEDATRLAALEAGEVDAINLVAGTLIDKVKENPTLQLAPTLAAPFFLNFVGFEKPDNPFHDKRVREAASLALDRQALSEAETGGFSPVTNSWIPNDWPGALKGPEPRYDPDRAKQLLAEAGYPDGFEVEMVTPVPPYFSLGERVVTQLRAVGIRSKVNQMERAAFIERQTQKPTTFQGIILNALGAPGDAANRIRNYATCQGFSSVTCLPQLDEMFAKYEQSVDLQEREKLLNDVQQYILDEHIYPPVYRLALVNAVGPRLANKWEEIFGSIPQYVYIGPYEDLMLRD
ncbi:MAG TPA: ABC transporter substrate-binding protein [Dehalococcoidia bacterium]|nr:ABC transporter substrate-binding protein [Dehalococcoidia bacterium]